MTTLFMQSPGLVGATPLGVVSPPTAAELAVFALPGLVAWWRADIGFASLTSWVDRKTTRRLTLNSIAWPTVQASGIGAKPSLVFGPTTPLQDPDALAFIPLTGDFTVAGVAKPVAASNWAPWGINAPVATSTYLMRRSDEKFELRQNGVQLAISAAAFGAASPFYFVDSWEQAATQRVGRINGAQVAAVTTPQAVTNSTLLVGSGGSPSFAVGLAGELLSEIMVFSRPLAKASNAADLGTLEGYITGRYGAVFG